MADFTHHECNVALPNAGGLHITASVFRDEEAVAIHMDSHGELRVSSHITLPLDAARVLYEMLGRAVNAGDPAGAAPFCVEGV